MTYPITHDYIAKGTKRRNGKPLDRVQFIVAHDTGNDGSTARNNVNYYKNSANDASASAHAFVDHTGVIECVPLTERALHVRYDRKEDNLRFGAESNNAAIGVELCFSTKGTFSTQAAYRYFVLYLADLCKKYGLDPTRHLIGHEHLDPARRTDPTNALKTIGKTFSSLVDDVAAALQADGVSTLKPASVSGTVYTVKKGDTLWGIAQRLKNATLADLCAWNPDLTPETLAVGQKVRLSAPKEADVPLVPQILLKRGDKGSAVECLQKALARAGFAPDAAKKDGGADGVFGAKTTYALKRFQMQKRLTVDGIYGPATRKALLDVLS